MEFANEIINWLNALRTDPDQTRLVFVVLIGILGFMASVSIALVLGSVFDPIKKRIDAPEEDRGNQAPIGSRLKIVADMGASLVPKAEEKRAKILHQLECAGFRSARALSIFFGFKTLGFVIGPLLVFAAAVAANRSIFDWLSIAVFAGVMAFLLPDVVLARAVRKRQKHLRHALPDALDLMVVCTEAGLGLNSAISRVADEIGVQHPELADELQLVIMHIGAGMDNRTALKDLERRTGVKEIGGFVTTLLQAMRFGTSIAESLRVFAEDMRDKRLQHAQEKAAQLSLKMLLPITSCMLPMFFVIAMGPAVMTLQKSFATIFGG